MKGLAISLVVLAACTEDAPTSSATLSTDPTVLFAHANVTIISHGGAADQATTISLTTQDGCLGGTTPVKIEIDLLANGTAITPGPIPIRVTDAPDVLPSALFMGGAASTVSGNLMITAASTTRIEGTGMITTSAGNLTLAFSALICP